MESGTQMTFEQFGEAICPWLNAGALEHPAKTSLMQDFERVSEETGVPLLEIYLDYLKKEGTEINPNGLSMRMLRECLVRTEDLTSQPFSLKWTRGGYDVEWDVLNSKDFGVPQNRERVYTVGHLRACGRKRILFDGERIKNHNVPEKARKVCLYSRTLIANYPHNCNGDFLKSEEGIRPYTPLECFRLQGWDDEYFWRASFVSKDNQLYKQAGNGVTVNVAEAIGKEIKKCERRAGR